MQFPTFNKNANRPTRAVQVNPPAQPDPDTRPAAQRFLDQQWRDLAASTVAAQHPLSLNRDSPLITEGGGQ